MPGDRIGETATGALAENAVAKPIDRVDRAGNRVLRAAARHNRLILCFEMSVAAAGCNEIVLEIWIVFPEVVPEAQNVAPFAGAELGRALARELSHLAEMLV